MADGLIDVDGCRLSARVTGSGSPVVVMLSSAGGAHEQWDSLGPLLATTSVSYGRPGLGGSDPLPPEQTAPSDHDWATRQLHALLGAAGLAPPYVLVSCSIGAYLADRFARLWPAEVAGLVLLDPTMITPLPLTERRGPFVDEADGNGLRLSREQCQQLLVAEVPQRVRCAVVSRADGTIPQEALERYWAPLTMAEADQAWRERQQEWVRRLRAQHVIANTAGHFVQEDQPELVAAIIDAVIAASQRGEPLSLTREQVEGAGGQLIEDRCR
jgi:pimeloyl-ACP methyl ester carboxylesterase